MDKRTGVAVRASVEETGDARVGAVARFRAKVPALGFAAYQLRPIAAEDDGARTEEESQQKGGLRVVL